MSRPRGGPTPMMEQYHRIKREHPDRILLYRMGDFYETFYEDAVTASRVLGITLTTRGKSEGEPVPLAGVPHHSVNTYIHRLLRAGHSVAICEQMEDPALAKGVVERAVTEVITPGTVAIEEFLPADEASYCLALQPGATGRLGYALGDIASGELIAGEDAATLALGLPARFRVRELIHPEGLEEAPWLRELRALYPELHLTPRRAWDFLASEAESALCRHFGVGRSELLGFRPGEEAIQRAAGALLAYFHELKRSELAHVDRIQFLRAETAMVLDRVTVENLELLRPLRGEDPAATLFGQLNRCRTRMGARLLARWLLAPLLDAGAIEARLDAVAELIDQAALRRELGELLGRAADLERLVGRLGGGQARARDLKALADTLALLPAIRGALDGRASALLAGLAAEIAPLAALGARLAAGLVAEPPARTTEGGVIADGFDPELDRLRALTRDGRQWILDLQEQERARSGIAKLKVGYNRVFGYYLEVGRSQGDKVPADFTLKQTLTDSLRYSTPALKSREEEILSADERRLRREQELFEALRAEAFAEHLALQANARALASLDVLAALAECAERGCFCRPEILGEPRLEIRGGRHPVVEALLAGGGEFIPNDLSLDPEREQIHLLTGPNMGGKSTFLRQTALIVVLAHVGSFVPAAAARVGLTDKIFTRVGASDNLARGQSTFLIEMEETAAILRGLGERSLVLMDEIGRGTSTYDGLSLAWAVLEYLHGPAAGPGLRPRTLFATHYHELTRLEGELPRLRNYHVTVKEWQETVVFLRRVEPGPAERSYGIHVARLAGLPAEVIRRAFQLLHWIEQDQTMARPAPAPGERRAQLELFADGRQAVLRSLAALDLESLTPLEALNALHQLQAQLREASGGAR
ncbi:DNA mismatch repair protein MutS [bacterium]|nr:DNA mismatch repair protein MutS [bacterium]